MSRYRRWVGLIIGMLWFPPLGAIFGYAIGWIIDSMSDSSKQYMKSQGSGTSDFVAGLLVLTAAVMKADGKITHAELDFVKNYYKEIFGERMAKEYILKLRDVLKKNLAPYHVISDINSSSSYHAKLQLVHFLFGIAKADGHISTAEYNEISTIAGYLRIRETDFLTIKFMHMPGAGGANARTNSSTASTNDYQILGVAQSATNDEIKKAFRKKAIEFHPDKVANLGPDIQNAAKEKFQKLNDAYNRIKKERNIN